MSNRPPIHQVRDPAAWLVLMSPARAEIAETLRLLGPCSVAEIAQTLDRPADTLYRHLDALRAAGFVQDAGLRKAGRNAEQVFDVVADDFIVDFHDGSGKAENKAIVATANSFLSAMGRAVRDSAAARQLEFGPSTRNISINYELSWLTPERFQQVRALIRQLKAIMNEGKAKREGRLYVSLAMACPVTRKRGSRRKAEPAAERSKPSTARRARRAGRSTKPSK